MTDDERRNGDREFTYDLSPGESFSEGVIEAVSAISGAPPVPAAAPEPETGAELDLLYHVVDPDALDVVFASAGADASGSARAVTFRYHGHEVTVRSEGRISVEPGDPTAGEAAD